MKTFVLALLFFFAFLFSISAQKNRSNYFAMCYNSVINFSGDPSTFSQTNLSIVDNSICDKQGNLVLFRDGSSIRNAKKNPLITLISSVEFIPNPNNENLYYCIDTSLFCYTIDISQNNGEGKIIEKKQLYQEKLQNNRIIVFHKDIIWLIYIINNKVLSFKVDKDGISSTPIVSDVVIDTKCIYTFISRFNLYGTKILVSSSSGLTIYDFDKTSGKVSNPFDLGVTEAICADFSPNGKLLYTVEYDTISSEDLIYQYKIDVLSQQTILASKKKIGVGTGGGYDNIGLSPDKKIFYLEPVTGYIGVINQPDKEGEACENQSQGIKEISDICWIPVIYRGSDYDPSEIEITINCSVAQFSFLQTPQSALWNFGDGSTSTDLNPSHTYVNSGTYNVQVLVNYTDGTSQTLTKSITIQGKPSKITILHD